MKLKQLIILLLLSSTAFSQSVNDYYKRAVSKYKEKDYSGAIIEYSRAIEIRPNAAVLYNNRGVCKYKLERFSDAIKDYDKCIELDQEYVHAYFNKGNSYLGIDEFESALLAYDKVLKLDKEYYEAYSNRSKALFEMGDYKSCIEDLNVALESNLVKKREKLYLRRGNAYFALKSSKEAISDYSKAIRLEEDYYKAYINRGQAYFKLDEYEKALDDFTLSMRLSPTDGESYYYRGLVRIQMMDDVKASRKDRHVVGQIKDIQSLQQQACSDFMKAKKFSYGKAYEAIQEYCKGVKIK